MDLVLRPLTRDDIPAWVELLAAIERVEHTGEHYGAVDLAEEMDNPEVEVGKDFVGRLRRRASWSASGPCCHAGPPRAPTRCT